VTTFYTDDESTLARFRYAPDASFDTAATWLQDGIAQAFRNNAARMAIAGANPALLAKEDPEKVGRANRAFSKASRPAMELITRHAINWTIVAAATPAWAASVFPNETKKVAMTKLWDAIFAASRVDAPDPVAAWRAHDDGLRQRAALLNDRRYSTLHFRGPGTDLRVGLADDHVWMGGGTTAGNGLACIPNIPTEEVFTTPHCKRVEGTVTSTKPLSYQGTLIAGIQVRFEGGRVVESHASQGEAVLRKMLETDEGASRLGEVALVPHSSPIAASGLLFSNTLFDENAASHIALGQAYSTCIRGGDTMNAAALAEKGANDSLIHVDWMIGSGEIDLDGIRAAGATEPLMRKGEWIS
jgi:aminopeptidase